MDRGRVSGLALTGHAAARMRQRGIRAEALEALLDFGRERHLRSRGRTIVYLDKAARAWAGGRGGRAYAILGRDGVVVTVGHRYRRIGRG